MVVDDIRCVIQHPERILRMTGYPLSCRHVIIGDIFRLVRVLLLFTSRDPQVSTRVPSERPSPPWTWLETPTYFYFTSPVRSFFLSALCDRTRSVFTPPPLTDYLMFVPYNLPLFTSRLRFHSINSIPQTYIRLLLSLGNLWKSVPHFIRVNTKVY